MPTIQDRFVMRRGLAADLASVNEVPLQGEWVLAIDAPDQAHMLKIGDGSTPYNSLDFVELGGGGAGGDDFAVASGADTITATFGTAPTLVDGLQFKVRAADANATTTPTFNPNSLGALTITKLGGVALAAGDISGAGHELIIRYRASPARYELLNPASVQRIAAGNHISIDLTDPREPVVAVTGLSAGAGYAEGISFPTSPGLNDKFYRTDLNFLCYYDGTRWLTTQEYSATILAGGTTAVSSSSSTIFGYAVAPQDYQLYATSAFAWTLASPTNNASNYWSVAFQWGDAAGSTSDITGGTFTTASDTAGTRYSHSVRMGVPIPSSAVLLSAASVKQGSPGNLVIAGALLRYRLIVT